MTCVEQGGRRACVCGFRLNQPRNPHADGRNADRSHRRHGRNCRPPAFAPAELRRGILRARVLAEALLRCARSSQTRQRACRAVARRRRAKDGGPDRDRTGDLLNAIQARSQLRYRPTQRLRSIAVGRACRQSFTDRRRASRPDDRSPRPRRATDPAPSTPGRASRRGRMRRRPPSRRGRCWWRPPH